MFSPLRSLWVFPSCLLALNLLTPNSSAQSANVTTWHNDNNRTGWQQNETILRATGTGAMNQNNFGLLWQLPVTGYVYAQPLAVTYPQTIGSCNNPCSLVFIATEQDMLYAFNAASNSSTPFWGPVNLAQAVNIQDAAVNCASGGNWTHKYPCNDKTPPSSIVGPYIGVTGTPVIDTIVTPDTLFVVGAVYSPVIPSVSYYLFAVNTTSGSVLAKTQIAGTVNGNTPGTKCQSTYPASGQVSFNSTSPATSNHLQRSALLLLNDSVYVGFAPYPEPSNNGWIFGYTYNGGNSFSQTALFNSTPYGTGGGIWGSGAGPASDGTYIYAATGNGTFQDEEDIPFEAGDSLVKFTSSLTLADFYSPSDDSGTTRCDADLDFSSGGVLLVPSPYKYTCTGNSCSQCTGGCNVVIEADKESKLYVANQASLGGFSPTTTTNIETVQTPCVPTGCPNNPANQGYWASPAYWFDGTHAWIYYSPTAQMEPTVAPYPVYGYNLAASGPSGPISQTATANTSAFFCQYGPTPSVSSNGSNTAILWAIENQNSGNPSNCPTGGYESAALHAFNASTLTQLYSSSGLGALLGLVTSFSTPSIFQGQVYVGTETVNAQGDTTPGVAVFGCLNSSCGN